MINEQPKTPDEVNEDRRSHLEDCFNAYDDHSDLDDFEYQYRLRKLELKQKKNNQRRSQ